MWTNWASPMEGEGRGGVAIRARNCVCVGLAMRQRFRS
jgi:hypothetical protein